MGDLIEMGLQANAPVFRLRGETQAYLVKLLTETGQFPTPPPLDKLFFPVYHMETLKTLVGGGLLLDPDFAGKCPMHFAMIVLGALYQRANNAAISKVVLRAGEEPDEAKKTEMKMAVDTILAAPMYQAGHGMVEYTMNTMLMRHFMPETYAGERLVLVFNPLTDKVELWAGHPLRIEQPTENIPAAPSENPGAAPVEQP